MKNIIDICKEFGLEVPADKLTDFNKAVSENYLTRAEHEKKLGRADGERDNWRAQAEAAQEALKGFEGVDLQTVQSELSAWKQKAEAAEQDYRRKLEERDFEDALKSALGEIRFTSEAAKRAVMAEIREAGLKVRDGKILGLTDLVASIRKSDASAFASDGPPPARFTTSIRNDAPARYKDKAEILAIRDAGERQAAIAQNLALFGKGD